MIARRIFKKRESNRKIILLFLCILFFLTIYYYITNKNKNFIIISENIENFYIIPEDRGGEKIANLDKKSLNLKSQQIIENNINNPEDLFFSIQFYSNNEFEKVSKYLEKITNYDETIYNLEDFYILAFSTKIGIEYFLLYKNFENREGAKNYCLDFLSKIENCLIVDTTKF